EWSVRVANDSTEPMYAMHMKYNSLRQLGYFNIQNSKDWNLWHKEFPDGLEQTSWFECDLANRVYPGEVFSASADIGKRFISQRANKDIMLMTGLPLSEGGEGVLGWHYFFLADLHSSTGGMSKTWANQYGLVPEAAIMKAYNAAEIEDPDSDGFDNLFEYIMDTDPTDTDSSMQMVLAPASRGGITVSVFPLSERAVYDVYGAKNAKKPLEYVGSFTSEDGGLILRGRDKKKIFELDARMRR
ncbi:MAG: hypothetical protein U9P12_07015, partial [Verrucomicrobiota bacterium]|nr:hypothetical protein [Verrucomicrobiota bacterium]